MKMLGSSHMLAVVPVLAAALLLGSAAGSRPLAATRLGGEVARRRDKEEELNLRPLIAIVSQVGQSALAALPGGTLLACGATEVLRRHAMRAAPLLARCRPVLNGAHGIWGDAAGNLYLAEMNPSRVTKLTPVP